MMQLVMVQLPLQFRGSYKKYIKLKDFWECQLKLFFLWILFFSFAYENKYQWRNIFSYGFWEIFIINENITNNVMVCYIEYAKKSCCLCDVSQPRRNCNMNLCTKAVLQLFQRDCVWELSHIVFFSSSIGQNFWSVSYAKIQCLYVKYKI
jgi:hypothetical protein